MVAIIPAILIICFYYVLGPYSFPDYPNYITIVKNGGFLYSATEFKAEWLTRFWLMNGRSLFSSPEDVVNALVVFVQVFFLVWLLVSVKEKDDTSRGFGKLYFTLALGPLLLTTTLRATLAYIAFAQIALNKGKFDVKSLLWVLLAVASHDSAIIVAGIWFLSLILEKTNFLNSQKKLNLALIGGFVSIFVLHTVLWTVRDVLVNRLGFDSVYLLNPAETSLLKIVWFLIMGWICKVTIDLEEVHGTVKTFIVAGYVLSCFAFVINNVVAIRLVLFFIGMALIVGGRLLPKNSSGFLRCVDLVGITCFCLLTLGDILRHTEPL